MPRPGYKQKCIICKQKWVKVTPGSKNPICYDCQQEELAHEITDPEMKKLFDLPDEFYKSSSFLRSVKIHYLRYENITERQRAAFEKIVGELKEKAKAAKE